MARKVATLKPRTVTPTSERYTFIRETPGYYVYQSTGDRPVKYYLSKLAAEGAGWTDPPSIITVAAIAAA